jgi:uncharacterized membrane protein
MRISILAIASVLALSCKPADDTPPADPRAGVESAARSPEPATRAAAPANTPARGRDDPGWSGTAADGTQVALRFERVECIDNMSGEKFEARAVLAAAGNEYGGCGRFRSNRP